MLRDFTFLFEPYRPERDAGEVDTAILTATSQRSDDFILPFECRVAARRLLYACITDRELLDPLDGLLLPPPYCLSDLSDWCPTRADIESAVDAVPPALDPVVALLPFHLAMAIGAYDARLRAAVWRLCWLLALPRRFVSAREASLLSLMAIAESGRAIAESGRANSASAAAQLRRGPRRLLRRAVTVGAFAAVGAAALLAAGGLSAPLVAPALSALAGAVGATAAAVAPALGGAALVGAAVATHAAALSALVAPALSAAHVTAIFGAGGAGLAGFHAARRTAESDIFLIRAMSELEPLEPLPHYSHEGNGPLAEFLRDAEGDAVSPRGGGGGGVDWLLEEPPRDGMVVPAHTRAITLVNIATSPLLMRRTRALVLAVQCALPGHRLVLRALRLLSGIWVFLPPSEIPEGAAGVMACVNRYARPTGAGCALCYEVRSGEGPPSWRLWVLSELSFLGNLTLTAAITDAQERIRPREALQRLRRDAIETDHTVFMRDLIVQCRFTPTPYVVLASCAADGEKVRPSTDCERNGLIFSDRELSQHLVEIMNAAQGRRKVAVAIVNRSRHLVRLLKHNVLNGMQSSCTPSVGKSVGSRQASLTVFTNASMSLAGAEGYFILEVINGNAEEPHILHRRYYMKLQFEVSAMNKVSADCIASATLQGLWESPIKLQTQSSGVPRRVPMADAFLSAHVCMDKKWPLVELRVEDFVERDTAAVVHKHASITIGVGGFLTVFDPRRPQQDQQMALWAPLLPGAALFGDTESYVVQWEDEYQTRFGRTIGIGSVSVTNQLGDRVLSKVTSKAKEQLMHGAIFAGIQAFGALKSTFSLPIYAVWAITAIDNAFATLKNRAFYAGKDLARALLDPSNGTRPVTLVGFSFGARVIVECLRELHHVGAFGIIENVYLLGATVSSCCTSWKELRRVVAGRLVNVYARGDWLLWMLYNANEAASAKPMAGVCPVSAPGVENINVSHMVSGHLDYARRLGEIIAAIPERPVRRTREGFPSGPGALVALSAACAARQRVSAAVQSFISSSPIAAAAIVSVSNCVAADAPGGAALCLAAAVAHGGFFAFRPPEFIPPGHAAVFGAIAGEDLSRAAACTSGTNEIFCEGSGDDVCGGVAYALAIGPATDVLFVLLFHNATAVVDAHVIPSPNPKGESAATRRSRLCVLAHSALEDPIILRVRVANATATTATTSTDASTVSADDHNDIDIDIDPDSARSAFRLFVSGCEEQFDAGGAAVVHIACGADTESFGAAVHIAALLSRAASVAERMAFAPRRFALLCSAAQPQAGAHAAPVPLEEMRRAVCQQRVEDGEEIIVVANCGRATISCANCSTNTNTSLSSSSLSSSAELQCALPPAIPPQHCAAAALRPPPQKVSCAALRFDCGGGGRCAVEFIAAPGGLRAECNWADECARGEAEATRVDMGDKSFLLVTITWPAYGPSGSDDDNENDYGDADSDRPHCSHTVRKHHDEWILLE